MISLARMKNLHGHYLLEGLRGGKSGLITYDSTHPAQCKKRHYTTTTVCSVKGCPTPSVAIRVPSPLLRLCAFSPPNRMRLGSVQGVRQNETILYIRIYYVFWDLMSKNSDADSVNGLK